MPGAASRRRAAQQRQAISVAGNRACAQRRSPQRAVTTTSTSSVARLPPNSRPPPRAPQRPAAPLRRAPAPNTPTVPRPQRALRLTRSAGPEQLLAAASETIGRPEQRTQHSAGETSHAPSSRANHESLTPTHPTCLPQTGRPPARPAPPPFPTVVPIVRTPSDQRTWHSATRAFCSSLLVALARTREHSLP